MSRDVKMDAHLDVPANGFAGRLEVIEGPTGRRQRSQGDKARIVAESLLPGVRVADVARRHGVTRWQVYDWRKQFRSGRLALPESAASEPAFAAVMVEDAPEQKAAPSCIEIVVGDLVIRAAPGVDDRHLSRIIRIARAVQ
jgi:transposase